MGISIRDASSNLPTANAFNYSMVGFDDVASTRFVVLAVGSGSVAPVPEPASWAMLTIGFGLIGSAVRRRPSLVPGRAA